MLVNELQPGNVSFYVIKILFKILDIRYCSGYDFKTKVLWTWSQYTCNTENFCCFFHDWVQSGSFQVMHCKLFQCHPTITTRDCTKGKMKNIYIRKSPAQNRMRHDLRHQTLWKIETKFRSSMREQPSTTRSDNNLSSRMQFARRHTSLLASTSGWLEHLAR